MSNYFKRLAARSKINLAGKRQAAAGSRVTAAMPANGNAGPEIDTGSDIEVHEEVMRPADTPPIAAANQASSSTVPTVEKPSSMPSASNAGAAQISATASQQNDTSSLGDPGERMTDWSPLGESTDSDGELSSPPPGKGRSAEFDKSTTSGFTQSDLSATTPKPVTERPHDEPVVQQEIARKNKEDAVEMTIDSAQAMAPGRYSTGIEASTATEAMPAGITENPQSVVEAETDPAVGEAVGAYPRQANSRIRIVDDGRSGMTGPVEAAATSAAPIPGDVNAKPDNRLEIKIGKVDLEIHQPVAAARPPAPQPGAHDTSSTSTATGNRLSRYYLRGGLG